MAFFGLFKKKEDDFDHLLKDPLTDPFGQSPDLPSGQSPFPQGNNDPFQSQTPELPGMPNGDNGDNLQSMSPNNYNTSANSFPQMQNQSFEQSPQQRRNKGPEVYEEMPIEQRAVSSQRAVESEIDKKDFEILNLKLDAIKSQLENLTARLNNLEKKPYEEELPQKRRYNW